MRRSQQRLKEMRDIMSLRTVGARLAEAKAVAAQRSLDRAQESTRSKQAELDQTVASWQASVQTGHFDPMASAFWGQAVNSGVEGVLFAQHDEKQQQDALSVAHSALGTATANKRCAETLFQQARKRWSRDAERVLDDERADQTTRSFARP